MAKDENSPKPPTPEELREFAAKVLKMARWSDGELTHIEIDAQQPAPDQHPAPKQHSAPEQHEKIGPDKLADQFIFSEEYVVSTGAGLCITPRGVLYMRMLEGL